MKCCLIVVLFASTASAQSIPFDDLVKPLPNSTARTVADVASWATVLTGLALDTRSSCIQANDRKRGCGLESVRLGVVFGVTEITKRLVHRRRPCAPGCGIDDPDKSFYSMHAAFAFSAIGGPRLAVTIPLGVGTGAGRILAAKHWLSDVLVGAGVGVAASRIR